MKNLFRLCATVSALAGIALNINAYTVEEIIGSGDYKDAADETYFSTYDKYDYEQAPLGHSSHIKLSKVITDDRIGEYDRTKIRVEGFTGFTGSTGANGFTKADFIFVLANEDGEPDADGEYLYLENDVYISSSGYWNPTYTANGPNASTDGKYYITAGVRFNDPDYYPYSFGFKKSTYLYTYYDWYGKIEPTADGEYRIEFANPAIMSSASNGPAAWISSWSSNTIYVIDHYAIETFTPNATFKCQVVPFTYNYDDRGKYGTPVEKEFQVKYTIDDAGNFQVLNLVGEGFAIGKSDVAMSGPRLYTGKYNRESGIATLDGGQFGWLETKNRSYMTSRTIWHHGALTTVRTDNSIFDSDFKDVVIKGSDDAENNQISHLYHFKPKSHWVSNGGLCRTYLSTGTMRLQPFAFVCYDNSNNLYDSSSAYTDGEFDAHEEVTLGIDHEVAMFAKNETDFYISTDMRIARNDMYAASYELWMAPKGNSTDVNSGYYMHENGHELGQMIATVQASDLKVTGRSVGATHHFQVQQPLSSIKNKDTNGKYVFYIKANYKPETGLSPTFHGLTAPEEISTGVESASAGNGSVCVKAVVGGINVSGAEGTVEVYTAGGTPVYSGQGGYIALPSGLYVVRADASAFKIAVK